METGKTKMKRLIYIVAINFEVQDYAKKTWEHYCKKYGFDFKIIDTPSRENMAPHWERYTVFERFDDYDEYIYVDADAMVRWDSPNFFEMLSEDKLYAVKDLGSLEWVYNGIKGYKDLFPNADVNWFEYFTTGFLKFSQTHKSLFNGFIQFHDENSKVINDKQYVSLRKGFDQTPFNYFVRRENCEYELLPEIYSLGHLVKKDILYNGMFMEIGWIWQFNGVPHEQRLSIMKQIWEHSKEKYSL